MQTRPEADFDSEPISPELILVSSPEVARRAREQLAAPVVDEARSALAPDGPLSREAPATVPSRRRKTQWWAIAAVLLFAAFAAGVMIRESRSDGASKVPAQSVTTLPVATETGTKPAATSPAPSDTLPAKPTPPKAAAPVKAPPAKAQSPTSTVKGKGAVPPRTATKPHANGTPAFVPSRVFAWPADKDATGYLVRFFRDGAKVYEARSLKPSVTLPPSFHFLAGRYRWEVLPALGSAPNLHYGSPIVDSTFVLARS